LLDESLREIISKVFTEGQLLSFRERIDRTKRRGRVVDYIDLMVTRAVYGECISLLLAENIDKVVVFGRESPAKHRELVFVRNGFGFSGLEGRTGFRGVCNLDY
jgi:hypothetical protein